MYHKCVIKIWMIQANTKENKSPQSYYQTVIRTTALCLVKQSHLGESLLFIFKFHILFKLSSFVIPPASFSQKSRLVLVIHFLPGTHAL